MSNEEQQQPNPAGQPPEAPAAEAPSPDFNPAALLKQLEETQAQVQENFDKALRTQAEMDNLRKRTARDVENARKFALEKFAGELLAVRDSLELGLDAARGETDVDKIREGTELTLKMLVQVMEKFGIEALEPQGERFDPDKHQAMSMQENAELEPNTVMAVLQKGYLLNERLLRPAMVVVTKAPADK